ncbi:hypothetical protein DBV15_00569 [Temnothorax longispinosus]|uniref:Uncharacterized protein n=1 Tax=Temnothorax longispinosus TaxID=300112 RepID=A0A4S2KSW3_9HYME|nr:hypothetical protein DBV15_00569 [Temnothorax longispinosus]
MNSNEVTSDLERDRQRYLYPKNHGWFEKKANSDGRDRERERERGRERERERERKGTEICNHANGIIALRELTCVGYRGQANLSKLLTIRQVFARFTRFANKAAFSRLEEYDREMPIAIRTGRRVFDAFSNSANQFAIRGTDTLSVARRLHAVQGCLIDRARVITIGTPPKSDKQTGNMRFLNVEAKDVSGTRRDILARRAYALSRPVGRGVKPVAPWQFRKVRKKTARRSGEKEREKERNAAIDSRSLSVISAFAFVPRRYVRAYNVGAAPINTREDQCHGAKTLTSEFRKWARYWYMRKKYWCFTRWRAEKQEKCESNRCIEVVRIGCKVIQQPDPSLRMVDAINGSPRPRSRIASRRRQEATLLCRRHAVLRGIDFQRAARRGGTCFDDDADYYPSYAAARSVGRGFAKKRAASLISSIRRPGNVPSKLLVELTLEDTH